jgi:hypothetical protein
MNTFGAGDGIIGSFWNRWDDHVRQPSRRPRTAFVPVVLAAGLAFASCGGSSDSSGSTTTTAAAAAVPAATAAPVATAAETTVAPVGTEAEAGATSCPDGYVEFDGVYPLRICDRGETVTQLQQALVDLGYDITVDGLFGPQTQEALIEALDGVGEIASQADLDALGAP